MTSPGRVAAPVVGVLALVAVFGVIAVVGLGLVRGSSQPATDETEPDRPPTSPTSPTSPTVPVPTTPSTVPDLQGPTVRLMAVERDEGSFPPIARAIGELDSSTVLSLVVGGFPEFATARARQCTAGERVTCGNAVDVQFREDGTASFQYLVHDDFAHPGERGACRASAAACSVVVQNLDGDGRAEIGTVFGDPVPASGELEVTPRTGLHNGDTVRVTARGQLARSEVEILVCAAPALTGGDRCGAPGPTARTVVDEDGTASATLRIDDGPVGTDEVSCRRGQRCAVVVRSTAALVRTAPVPIGFAEPPGAAYDGWRLGLGLGAAALLVAGGAWLVHRTDWAPVGEVAAPEIDEAVYADLDAIVAALPPEEDEEAVLSR